MPVVRFDKDHPVTSSEEMDRVTLEAQPEGISIAEVQRMLQRQFKEVSLRVSTTPLPSPR